MVRANAFVLVVFSIFQSALSYAADWPLYRGPNQDGISQEKIVVQWTGNSPNVVWRTPTNRGFSSFAISNGKVFTQVVRGSRQVCLALDAATGKELWVADIFHGKLDGGGDMAGGGDGPRSTPTVSDGKVYLLSPDLVVYCLDANTGKPIWKCDLIEEHHGKNIMWESAASVALDGDLVFVPCGGPGESMLGLNKDTGAVVWKTGNEQITHSTPIVTTILDQRQVIFFMHSGLVSLDPKDGRLLWKFPFPYRGSAAISPVVSGDIVYVSSQYGHGSAACRIAKQGSQFTATQLWSHKGNEPVCNQWSTPVCKDGYLYGMFGPTQYKTGPMKCVDIATGDIKWTHPNFGQGNVILVGDRLVALAEDGNLVIVEATPDAYREIARTKAFNDKCWTTPAFADGKIYVRSISQGICYDVSQK